MIRDHNWKAKQVDSTYIVSIANGAEIVETLTDFCTTQNLFLGYINGIGAVNEATLRFFDPDTKSYQDQTFLEQMEISNLTGNITEMDGNIYLHVHITLGGRNFQCRTGHLQAAVVSGACELFVVELNSRVQRVKNNEIGLNLLRL
ncbi:DNA-binding protein [Sphingobacterium olei]|uniref:DNA-binding protein n=1 Tax=Sphingobacterium olei TaxID=2571155 RepID=A0A4U0NEP9_9SPHI|nr:PPC domain-containing DNA-binding protein [Sphingobacterium olei]TJZ52536.1 DNA-binding protein [Sphingobacterium olei]